MRVAALGMTALLTGCVLTPLTVEYYRRARVEVTRRTFEPRAILAAEQDGDALHLLVRYEGGRTAHLRADPYHSPQRTTEPWPTPRAGTRREAALERGCVVSWDPPSGRRHVWGGCPGVEVEERRERSTPEAIRDGALIPLAVVGDLAGIGLLVAWATGEPQPHLAAIFNPPD